MAGGNDGLNMVIPFADDTYHRVRPKLAIAGGQNSEARFLCRSESAATGLKSLFDEGHLGFVQGVGYPNPNRSHFRSTEIWQTASDAERNCTAKAGLGAISITAAAAPIRPSASPSANEMPQAFAANTPTGVDFSRPEQFRWKASETTGGQQMNGEETFLPAIERCS